MMEVFRLGGWKTLLRAAASPFQVWTQVCPARPVDPAGLFLSPEMTCNSAAPFGLLVNRKIYMGSGVPLAERHRTRWPAVYVRQ